jgi:hypothetical protein
VLSFFAIATGSVPGQDAFEKSVLAALLESENEASGGPAGGNPLADFETNRARILEAASRNAKVDSAQISAKSVANKQTTGVDHG